MGSEEMRKENNPGIGPPKKDTPIGKSKENTKTTQQKETERAHKNKRNLTRTRKGK